MVDTEALLDVKGIPLYYQLETLLRNRIISQEFEAGARLPSESALAAEYKVSRITVRQALFGLERNRLIVRKRGKGTFVSQQPKNSDLSKLAGSIDDLILWGLLTKTKIIDFSWIEARGNVIDSLGLPEKTNVLRIERVRFIKDNPFAYVVNYLPPSIGQKIQQDELLDKPLLKILEDDLQLDLAESIVRIEAKIADSETARLLGVRLGSPLLRVEITILDSNHRAVEYSSILFRGDRYSYTVRRNRIRGTKDGLAKERSRQVHEF